MMPVSTNNCVMNRICRKIEGEFDSYIARNVSSDDFDPTIMKSGAEYTRFQYESIEAAYNEYTRRSQEYARYAKLDRIEKEDVDATKGLFIDEFRAECASIVAEQSVLCDIIVDMCYSKEGSKQFAWDMVGDTIFENLLGSNDGYVNYPVKDDDGDFEYCGVRFSVERVKIRGVFDGDCIEREGLCEGVTC